jgi:hypothetical protein
MPDQEKKGRGGYMLRFGALFVTEQDFPSALAMVANAQGHPECRVVVGRGDDESATFYGRFSPRMKSRMDYPKWR